ncbi:MAG: ISL3 family transposase [Armatimonadetes bacterium]|nr:ISL3 family transposase [Armatimonadota bacterium]
MSTSLLYRAFGIRGYSFSGLEHGPGRTVIRIVQSPKTLRCSRCGSGDVIRRGQWRREFRTVPIGSRRVVLALPIQRVQCRRCGAVGQVKVAFADERRSYTRTFERYALELSKHMTILDVAHHLGVSWDVIKDIQKRYLRRRFGKPKLRQLRLMAVDEISIGRGHKYLTVVLNLETGAVVFVGDGKGAGALKPFWTLVKRARARIRAVAMDMSPAYIAAVQANLPKAAIVFDRFHVMKLYNEKLSDLRRDLQREAIDLLHKKALKGLRWVLLKNPENVTDRHDERQRLEEALRINKPLAAAYYLRDDLRRFWEQPDKATAAAFLRDWIARAEASGVRMLKDFAKTLAAHRSGLLAYYDFPISTGPLEGTNTKIRVLQRQAYGFRDIAFFKLKILGLHETKYALVG